eukprot:CAMPEP_0116055668 /NCGR_PEP_ID=MMETSP0322-20121206/3544_1 /TAXON_ID=163516 /ORGANISM="Leptocylindrus danicus var. apora, Strain B651" /LENGTH=657 /DNA_ID=CAMNT_0003539315 /DNA_START=159 /DNA_END=2132 /DNA_ORIENTATION=+
MSSLQFTDDTIAQLWEDLETTAGEHSGTRGMPTLHEELSSSSDRHSNRKEHNDEGGHQAHDVHPLKRTHYVSYHDGNGSNMINENDRNDNLPLHQQQPNHNSDKESGKGMNESWDLGTSKNSFARQRSSENNDVYNESINFGMNKSNLSGILNNRNDSRSSGYFDDDNMLSQRVSGQRYINGDMNRLRLRNMLQDGDHHSSFSVHRNTDGNHAGLNESAINSSLFDPFTVRESESIVLHPSQSQSLFDNIASPTTTSEVQNVFSSDFSNKTFDNVEELIANRERRTNFAKSLDCRGGRAMSKKIASAPILGQKSSFFDRFGVDSGVDSSGSQNWDRRSAAVTRGNSVFGNKFGLGMSQSTTALLSNVPPRSGGDVKKPNRFLSLNRPKANKGHQTELPHQKKIGLNVSSMNSENGRGQPALTQQFFAIDGRSLDKKNLPRCDYIDFSLIDDSKVTDEMSVYGQTYESIMRNPDVSMVQISDVVVVPPTKNARVVPTFPRRLMNMLNRTDVVKAICWLPHGRSFIVRDPKLFEDELYPRFFKPAKYKSFQRQLNLWKFLRVQKGFDAGSYYHPLFLRNKPNLVKKIILPKNEDTDRRSSNPNNIEPDFYELAKVRPLAELTASKTPLPPKATSVLSEDGKQDVLLPVQSMSDFSGRMC